MDRLTVLNAMLDELAASLPVMIQENPDPADFWPAFAGQADLIEDQAGEHCAHVCARIDEMLAQHGRYMAGVDFQEA